MQIPKMTQQQRWRRKAWNLRSRRTTRTLALSTFIELELEDVEAEEVPGPSAKAPVSVPSCPLHWQEPEVKEARPEPGVAAEVALEDKCHYMPGARTPESPRGQTQSCAGGSWGLNNTFPHMLAQVEPEGVGMEAGCHELSVYIWWQVVEEPEVPKKVPKGKAGSHASCYVVAGGATGRGSEGGDLADVSMLAGRCNTSAPKDGLPSPECAGWESRYACSHSGRWLKCERTPRRSLNLLMVAWREAREKLKDQEAECHEAKVQAWSHDMRGHMLAGARDASGPKGGVQGC